MRRHQLPRLVLLLILVSLNACASRIPLRRTLPEWVENVYVPMFTNSSTQPGLEELGTLATVEELAADGRLTPTSRADADLVIAVDIEDFIQDVDSFEDDEFPSVSRMTVMARLLLYEPSDMTKPFADLGTLEASQSFVSDIRRTDFSPDVEARKDLMRVMARTIVEQTLTGYRVTPEDTGARKIRASSNAPYQIRTRRGITIMPDVAR